MQRYLEIDFLRGIAIVMMIVFHFLFDLNFFGYYPINVHTGFWRYFGLATASLFIALSGISLTISHARRKNFRRQAFRGLSIFSLGMAATLATWLFLGSGFVVFGILHFIGFSIIVSWPFLRFGRANLLLGILAIAAGIYLQGFVFGFPWLLWLGLRPEGFYSVDYFPVLPWFGVFLAGIFLGNSLYPKGERNFKMPKYYDNYPKQYAAFGRHVVRNTKSHSRLKVSLFLGFICFLGRHSLVIYLLHQVVIVAALQLSAIIF